MRKIKYNFNVNFLQKFCTFAPNKLQTCELERNISPFLYFPNYYIFDSSSFDAIVKWIVEKGKGFQNTGKMHAFIFPLHVFEIFQKKLGPVPFRIILPVPLGQFYDMSWSIDKTYYYYSRNVATFC